jgi:hypothetical protein
MRAKVLSVDGGYIHGSCPASELDKQLTLRGMVRPKNRVAITIPYGYVEREI